MMTVDASVSVYLHREPVDFRKQINGLAAIVESDLGLDPFQEAIYAFTNRSRRQAKLLYWQKNGFCLWQKRLEQHRFVWPRDLDETVLTLTGEQLQYLLDGYDIFLIPPHQRLRYRAVS